MRFLLRALMTEQLLPLQISMTGQLAVRSGTGTPQVPCQEWCRYPAGALSGVVQLPSRNPVQLAVRSGTGTPQVPCTASCQEWCRYPAGALSGVVQKLAH